MKQKTYITKFLDSEYRSFYVTEPELARRLVVQLLERDFTFGLDTETMAREGYEGDGKAGLSPHTGKIRLIQLFDGENVIVLDMRHVPVFPELKKLFATKKFVAHMGVFEIAFLKSFNLPAPDVGCTYIATKLIFHATFPTDEGLSASLENTVNSVFKKRILKSMQTSNWGEPDLTFEQIEYAGLDAVCTRKLAEKLGPGLDKLGLDKTYSLYKEAQYPIVNMQMNGIGFDKDAHKKMIEIWRGKLIDAKRDLLGLTKLKEITSHTIAHWLEKHLEPGLRNIWPLTDTGKLSTSADTFSEFEWLPIVKPFSEFQKKAKLTTTYGTRLSNQINLATGRLHASYKLCGARTGRLSSSNPNLQQLPRSPKKDSGEPDARSLFVASHGKTFLCADYSQIELRVAAEVSQDRAMLEAYRKGKDLHELTASKICGFDIATLNEEERKKKRQMAKAFNFGLLFGLGSKKFSHYAKKSYGVTVSDEDAARAIEIFRETYFGYRGWQIKQAKIGAVNLAVRTPMGKLRRLAIDNHYGPSMNTPIQGGAAEVMLRALIRLDKHGVKFVNCVHDELLLECDESEVSDLTELMEQEMTEAYLDVFPKGITRDLVEVKNGTTWASAK